MSSDRSNKETRKKADARLGRRERKRLEQRDRILRTALRLFAKQGYEGVSVADITESVDVAKGTFFNYFPTKADILVAFWSEVVEEVLTYGESLLNELTADSFSKFFRYFARRVEQDAQLFDLLVCQVAYLPALRQVEQEAAPRTRRLYEQFLSARNIRGRQDIGLVCEVIRDIWVGTLRQWVYSEHQFSLSRKMNRKLALFLQSLESR